MENGKQIITHGISPRSIPEREILISLIAEDLLQLKKSHYQDEYLSVPAKLTKEYLIFNDSYWSALETCLRDYDGTSKEILKKKFKKHELKKSREILEGIVDNTVDYIANKVGDKKSSTSINVDKNKNADPLLVKKFEEKITRQIIHDASVTDSMLKNESSAKASEKDEKFRVIHVIDLPKTTVQGIERYLRKIAEQSLVEDALVIIEDRVFIEGEYRFRKFVRNISEIYDDFILNPKSGKPKKSLLKKKDSTLIKQVMDNYEVIDKRKYLLNKRKFESALRGSFMDQVNSARESLKKEG